MDFVNGEDRILYVKINGAYLPIGCLTDNSFEESVEFLNTTTRDNGGWNTSRPLNQQYSIPFNGVQVNSTLAGGNFNVASYDKLKQLKRNRQLIDWKIQGTVYPIVDYGKGYGRAVKKLQKSTCARFRTRTYSSVSVRLIRFCCSSKCT
jgi:hypothetical protein